MRYVDHAPYAAADRRLLAAMRDCGNQPGIAAAARALSFAGEHGALWLATGLTGAAADRARRGPWLRATALVAGAHLASMAVKRVVRRPRPGMAEPAAGGRGAGPMTAPASGPAAGSAAGLAAGSRVGSVSGPAAGSEAGLAAGSRVGLVSGSVAGGGDGSVPGSRDGSVAGVRDGSASGAEAGSLTGSPPGFVIGAVTGPVSGSVADFTTGFATRPVSGSADISATVRGGGQRPGGRDGARADGSGAGSRTPLVRTAGAHSFPSSHATSAAAAVVAFGALMPAGRHLVPPVAAAMCVSRLVAGVHYPTDVVAGVALGGIAARLGARWAAGDGGRGR